MSSENVVNFCTYFPADVIGVENDLHAIYATPRDVPPDTEVLERYIIDQGRLLRRQLTTEEIQALESSVCEFASDQLPDAQISLDFIGPNVVNVAILVPPEEEIATKHVLDQLAQDHTGIRVTRPQHLFRK